MRLYAQTPARRNRQVLGDLIALVLMAAAVKFALVVREAIMLLVEPGRKVEFGRQPRLRTRQRRRRGLGRAARR